MYDQIIKDQRQGTSFGGRRNGQKPDTQTRRPSASRAGIPQATVILLTGLSAFALSTPVEAADTGALSAGMADQQQNMTSTNTPLQGGSTAGASSLQLAQGAAASASSRPIGGGPVNTSVEAVTVTARRREENVQSVPLAVTALSGEKLKKSGVESFRDLAQLVPAVQLGAATDAFGRSAINISIRGIRSSSIGVYTAEFKTDPRTLSNMLYDLQSVQVLKGPQGTLFGSNSTSGAFLIQPVRPSYVSEGSAEIRGGAYGMYGGTAVVNIPLVDQKAAVRLAVDGEHHDGFIQGPVRDYDDDNHYSGRISIRLDPTSNITNNTVIEGYRAYSQGGGANLLVGYLTCAQGGTAGCLYAVPMNGLPSFNQAVSAQVANGYRRTNLTQSLPVHQVSGLATNTTEVGIGHPFGEAIGDIKLRAIVGGEYLDLFENGDEDGLVLPITNVFDRGNRLTRASAELQVQGHGPRVDWVIGGYWERQWTANTTDTIFYGGTAIGVFINPLISVAVNTQEEYSVYTQITGRIVGGLSVTGGIRYTSVSDHQDKMSKQAGRCTLPLNTPGVDLVTCHQFQSLIDRTIPYNIGADYKFSDNLMAYFATRRGFTPGGFNSFAALESQTRFQPEILVDYELGVKSTWHLPEFTVLANADIFRNNYSDIQRSVVTPYMGRTNLITLNAASARIDGIEWELGFTGDHLSINLGGAYIDPRYLSFVTSLDGVNKVNLTANALAQAPRFTANLGADYRWSEVEHLGQISVHANVSYQSTVYFQDVNATNNAQSNTAANAFNTQTGYAIANVRLTLDHVAGVRNLMASLWINNVFNTPYYVFKLNGGAASSWATGVTGEPRMGGVSLRYRY
jgi:iron complex outermembrane receptor protein